MSSKFHLTKKQKKRLLKIIIAAVMLVIIELFPFEQFFEGHAALYAEFALCLVPYLIVGGHVLVKAAKGAVNGRLFDENFLMSIATIGAFCLVFFPDSSPHMAEGVAVMLFYQIGELFEDLAVGKSRKSITDMLDIVPDACTVEVAAGTANAEGIAESASAQGTQAILTQTDPASVRVGSVIVVKPGERVPIDGEVLSGASEIDTSALTGESAPVSVHEKSEVLSGSTNLTGVLRIKTTKAYADSTVSRIMEMVEAASERKARTENFITRFARIYTPVVVVCAVLLSVFPPLFAGQAWATWIERGLIFLVVSCPCALVISVPLSFFGGIGAASKKGILVKGSNYLEALSKTAAVAFDKTGTLTSGTFEVVEVAPAHGFTREQLLGLAAAAESFSNHPIAASVRAAWEKEGGAQHSQKLGTQAAAAQDTAKPPRTASAAQISNVTEVSGAGVRACVDGINVLVGNDVLMNSENVVFTPAAATGTVLYVAQNGEFAGHIVIADVVKPESAQAIENLHAVGVKKCIMLTGDREAVAQEVASKLKIDEYYAQLLPQNKVEKVEELLAKKPPKTTLAFAGDGVNDAPVLMRCDVGIAMGAAGSDAAIEAADVVLMDDNPLNIALSIRISKKTMRIVYENIVFALAVKVGIMVLAAVGVANMWLAVFGDVGVCVLAILNAMRCLRISAQGKK